VERIRWSVPASFVLALPGGGFAGLKHFQERIRGSSIQIVEGTTWEVLAHADVALAASGTVTIEAALLGTPMVTFYRVTRLSWWLGKLLVRVPYYSMVNLVVGRAVVPELMQNECSGKRLAAEAVRLLTDEEARRSMREELRSVARALEGPENPFERAARVVEELAGVESA